MENIFGNRFIIAPNFKIGLRTIKTALAVFLCLILQFILPMDRMNTFYAAIAAVVVMRETAGESFVIGMYRFLGTLIGGFIGFLLINLQPFIPYYNEGLYALIIPIGVLICIYFCVLINMDNAAVICCVVFLGIALDPALNVQHTLSYVLLRIFFTSVGIIIATLLNKYFFPYKDSENGD